LYYAGNNQYLTSLWRQSVTGGDAERVLAAMPYFFSVGRAGIYFGGRKSREIWYWDASERRERLLYEFPAGIALGLSVSPDERELCVSQSKRHSSDIMMFDHFR